MLMSEYLDSWVKDMAVTKSSPFIVISRKVTPYEDEWDDTMEHDFTDGRLWVDKNFKLFLSDLFGKSESDMMVFLAKWFEKRYNVEVEFVE